MKEIQVLISCGASAYRCLLVVQMCPNAASAETIKL